MCGISGIINRKNEKIDVSVIQKMNDSIAHRGPDGEGFFFGDNFAFGHRRLSILDLSSDGSQPMKYADRNTITFNGEIYNYLELRAELVEHGFSFITQTDTEVILAAYEHWGEKCVEHFNGMWSFALYDVSRQQLFCSRDRFGVKPFYYFVNDDFFAFGSEIKQLLPFLSEVKANRQVVLEYIISGVEEYSNDTFFEGIVKLQQGCNLMYDLSTHEYRIDGFYELVADKSLKNVSESDAVALYKKQLEESVKIRMRSDVEVGVCLSGGLDSSAITAISSAVLSEESSNKIKSIHVKVDEKSIDESKYAIAVAEFCATDLIMVEPSHNDFIHNIDRVITVQEEPFGSPSIFLQYFVLKEARKQNCLVMLDGQGGDETLLGYERYYPAFLLTKRGFSMIKEFFNSSKNSKLSQLELLKYFFYFTNYKQRLKRLKEKHNYLKTEITERFESPILKNASSQYRDIEKLQIGEITATQLPHLLKYEDKNSMANSVETRLPFLDYRCVELALSLPDEYKIKAGWTKNILRKAIDQQLPSTVIWRKDKLGFNAPEKNWLEGIHPEMKQVILNSPMLVSMLNLKKFNFEALDLRTQWRLFNLAKWQQIFNVNW